MLQDSSRRILFIIVNFYFLLFLFLLFFLFFLFLFLFFFIFFFFFFFCFLFLPFINRTLNCHNEPGLLILEVLVLESSRTFPGISTGSSVRLRAAAKFWFLNVPGLL